MLMADDRSNAWSSDECFSVFEGDEFGDGLSINMGDFLDILEETPDSSERKPEDSSSNHVTQGLPNLEGVISSDANLSGSSGFFPSYNVGPSDLSNMSLGGSESAVRSTVFDDLKINPSLQLASPVHSSSGSLTDWKLVHSSPVPIVSQNVSVGSSLLDGKELGHEMRGEMFSFPTGCFVNNTAGNTESSNVDHYHDSQLQFIYSSPTYSSENQMKKENKLKVLEATPKVEGYSAVEVDDSLAGYGEQYLSSPYVSGMVHLSCSSASNQFDSYSFGSFPDSDTKMTSIRTEKAEHFIHGKSSKSMMSNQMKIEDLGVEVPFSEENLAARGLRDPNYGQDYASSASNMVSTFNCNHDFLAEHETLLYDKKGNCSASLHDNDVMGMKSFADVAGLSHCEASNLSSSGSLTSNSSCKSEVLAAEDMYLLPESKRPRLNHDGCDGTTSGFPMASSVVPDPYLEAWDINTIGLPISSTTMQPTTCTNLNRDKGPGLPMGNGSDIANSMDQKIQRDSMIQICDADDGEDVCILEDISGPAQLNISTVYRKSPAGSQPTMVRSSLSSTAVGHTKLKANRERHIFRAALQDLCQQLSEDSPPDGFMAVPLLKHQRLALSWMVRKENAVSCSGGILADDQGLGKTVSTIALILKERSPSSVESSRKQSEPETLNLDDDDDDIESALDVGKSNQGDESCQANGLFCGRKSTSARGKRRPAAGTLIVCPTSVLRQWCDELQSKVTSKANLSVLVYHGSNRTKDPHELAKYDVVLTTYAIVSMEVPKKPLGDEDDDDAKGTSDSPVELSSSKNRKYPPSSNKKTSKSKKSVDVVDKQDIRPLAGVGWFRVILDEAQSIKNHRTQVARACWGLRAKRRWCLSGTPMQNAVDDLYSYFRFLKFDPYSVYKAFCSGIKHPIQRSPVNGYKRLQVVLKTIMLRRTKATFIDGEPIINLPPKTIKLHKVDFSPEERDFYLTLEADSRAQYAEYAAAGTVQKNYVNILLMLLRLRQACDHPLLVKGFNLNSKSISSVEMVKKIPQEKQLHLLQRYEASLAICSICRDPPEDAVITRCGHIFCNQCICEHLSGDDTHCPAANCKSHLKGVAVFSVAALRCSLFDKSTPEGTAGFSHPKLEQISEPPPSSGSAYGSSKIRAALEVLQSLNKRHDCARTSSPSSIEEGIPNAENASYLHSTGLHESVSDEKNKRRDEHSRGSDAEKAIVFSQWTRMLDLLEECLKNSSIQYRRLDGTMSVVARDKAVKDFNTLPEVTVMIMSLKAASLGLNMVAACHVLMLDLWWNPTTEDQAIDRAHRIGQTRPVTVLRLTVKNTVEDRILALQQKKREMVSSAFGDDDSGTRDTRLTVEDLNYLFS